MDRTKLTNIRAMCFTRSNVKDNTGGARAVYHVIIIYAHTKEDSAWLHVREIRSTEAGKFLVKEE